jgi:hypothetical protein
MARIFQNFAAGLEALNQMPVGPHAVSTSDGRRAYLVNGKPLFSDVHFQNIGEDRFAHETLRKRFKTSSMLQGRVYAGTAGENTLSLIAASKASAAILFDINPFQTIFWREFIAVLAVCPEPEDFARKMKIFAEDFYYKLSKTFNFASLKKEYPRIEISPPFHIRSVEEQLAQSKFVSDLFGGQWNEEEEKDRINGPVYDRENGQRSSPFRHMSYANFARYFAMRMGWDCGYTWLEDRDLDWFANKDFYQHLHMIAKHGALGALTFDITDQESCSQLCKFLDTVEYTPLENEASPKAVQRGAKIGTLYLSNICYYLDWTAEEIKACKDPAAVLKDYSGRLIDAEYFAKVSARLRELVASDAAIIRFDRVREGLIHPLFHPLFDLESTTPHIPTPLEKGGLIPRDFSL